MHAHTGFQAFASRSAASVATADLLASLLAEALDSGPRAQASLVLSGGTTPGPCFDHLAGKALDWSRVTVLPSDERWVAGDDPDSNEHLLRSRLLQGRAATGKILSFFSAGIEAAQAPALIEAELANVTTPFSATLLGMGEDGHFASLFSDFTGLRNALDPGNPVQCIMVRTAASPYQRISLTLSALLNSVHIVQLIFGEAKRGVYERAMSGGGQYPVEALLHQPGTPLTVIWAP